MNSPIQRKKKLIKRKFYYAKDEYYEGIEISFKHSDPDKKLEISSKYLKERNNPIPKMTQSN